MKDSTINILMEIFVLITCNNAFTDGDEGGGNHHQTTDHWANVPIYTHGMSMHGVLVGCNHAGHSKRPDAAKREEKIVINIRIASTANINPSDHKYLLLDELFDAGTKTRTKLLHPYLIELSMVGPMLMYPLEYENVLSGQCDGKTWLPANKLMNGNCETENNKYGKEANNVKAKQLHHSLTQTSRTEQRRDQHAVHKRYNDNDYLPLFATFGHQLATISNVQHQRQSQQLANDRPNCDLLQCYHCLTLPRNNRLDENCSCCANKFESENWKMFEANQHNGRVNQTEKLNEDLAVDQSDGYECSDASGCWDGKAIRASINKLSQNNHLSTISKKESNYSHSPNGANGKMLPNYVKQAKLGAKLLHRNTNDGEQKSSNSIDNAGPNNIDYAKTDSQQIEFHNNDDGNHATMSEGDAGLYDNDALELAAKDDNHKSASPDNRGDKEDMIGKLEFTQKTGALIGSEGGYADDNVNEIHYADGYDDGNDSGGGGGGVNDEEDGLWRTFNDNLNMPSPTAASVNSRVMNWRRPNHVALLPKYIEILNEHPPKYPQIFRQHRNTGHSREDRLMADRNLTIADKMAFLDMLHQPEKKSADDVAHSNGANENSYFTNTAAGYPNNRDMDRSRRSFTNADSISNNAADDDVDNDDDDNDDADNGIDDWNKLIELYNQRRFACYRVYHMDTPLPFRGYDLRIYVQHDGGEWLNLTGLVSVSNLQTNTTNHPVSISLTTSNQQPSQIKFSPTDGTNNDTLDLFNLKNHKLLVSTDTNPLSDDLMVLDPEKISNDQELRNEMATVMCDTSPLSSARWSRENDGMDAVPDDNDDGNNGKLNQKSVEYLHKATKERSQGRVAIVKRLSEVENFRFGEQVIEKCRHDERQECLSLLHKRMVDDNKITIEFPFVGNRLIQEQQRRVQIASITTDGTTMETLNVEIVVTNLGNKMAKFGVVLHNCDGSVHINATKWIKLVVNKAMLVEFQLVLPMFYEHKERNCEVLVEDERGAEVAQRRFMISSTERCFCVWTCECFCGPAFIPSGGVHACHELSTLASTHAGLIGQEGRRIPLLVEPVSIVVVCMVFMLFVLCLGIAKATIGCCHPRIDQWQFSFLQPHIKYAEASRCRKFTINTIFFFVFPCVACCKCFTPNDDDIDDQHRNVRWFRGIRQQEQMVQQDNDDDTDPSDNDDVASNEKSQLLSDADSGTSYGRMTAVSDSVTPSVFRDFSIDDDDDGDDDLDFVVAALNDSRQSLRVLDGHCSEVSDLANPAFVEAKGLVKRLMLSKIVYRIFHHPIGHVNVAENEHYSIRGYFLPDIGTGYQFITTMPLRQYWKFNAEKHSLVPIVPPLLLLTKDFTRTYANKLEVLKAGDLTTTPSVNAPCINVLHQDASLYSKK